MNVHAIHEAEREFIGSIDDLLSSDSDPSQCVGSLGSGCALSDGVSALCIYLLGGVLM